MSYIKLNMYCINRLLSVTLKLLHPQQILEKDRKTHMNEPTFDSFSLSPEILEALRLLHYDAPTPVQQQAIPAILDVGM